MIDLSFTCRVPAPVTRRITRLRDALAASASRAGTAWTDHRTARQERSLKHRPATETRTVPIPPDLVRLLRAHIRRYGIRRYGTTPDGRVFQTARGGILQDSAYTAVWAETREAALTPAQCRSAAVPTTCGMPGSRCG